MRREFWSLLDTDARAELLAAGRLVRYAAEETILRQDEASDHLLVVRRGCVKVVADSQAGYRAVLAIRNAGDLLGEQASLDGRPRSASLYALTEVEVLVLPSKAFLTVLRGRQAVAEAVQLVLSDRLREADRHRTAGTGAVQARLAALLLELGERYGQPQPSGAVRIALPLSQDDLAGLVLSSRRTVSRVLEQWRRLGWVTTGRRALVVARVDALREQAVDGASP